MNVHKSFLAGTIDYRVAERRAYVNNLFNKKYYSDVAGELCFFQKENKLAQSWASLFPQSEINFIFGLTYSF